MPGSGNDDELRKVLLAARKFQLQLEELRARTQEPIAIVGWAARTPFESAGVGLWEGLAGGVDASSEVPKDRWDASALPVKRGGFLSKLQEFDARFFGLSDVDAQGMDPKQRLALEMSWEALAHAGIPLHTAQRLQTSVYMGSSGNEYTALWWDKLHELQSTAAVEALFAGGTNTFLAGRVSYAFGLTGPSVVVDGGCTASLVAVHQACEGLRARTSDIALAGGVHVNLMPATLMAYAQLGFVSSDGRCRSFDATGAGFGRGEGCGILVLKRLSDALQSGDRIHAVIRGSAFNHNGSANGLAAPNGLAQERAIRAALEFAKVSPGDVQYVEAHGTGTTLGDSIELESLAAVFNAGRPSAAPLVIGSLKSNIGHLEAAAGVLGLIKVLLGIEHRQLPPSVHFEKPNTDVAWDRVALRVQTKLGPWPQADKPLVAGVTSYSMIGTNAHVIVSEASNRSADMWREADSLAAEGRLLPLCISAKTPEALRAYAERYAEQLSAPREGAETWRDVAYTSCERATHLEHRLVALGSSPTDSATKLRTFLAGDTDQGVTRGKAITRRQGAVFVFTNAGSEWWGMGRELLARDSIFQRTIAECETWLAQYGGWSLREELQRDEASSRLRRPEIAPAALVALQIALLRQFGGWGVAPAAVIGHGVGEISAAFAADALTLEQACRVAVLRGQSTDADKLREALRWLEPRAPQLPMVSTVTGAVTPKMLDAGYWATQMRSPVMFAQGTQALLDLEYDLFLEVGPSPVLLETIADVGSRSQKALTLVPTLRRDQDQEASALASLGALHCAGYPVDWKQFWHVPGRVAPLPRYPWQRERHWIPGL